MAVDRTLELLACLGQDGGREEPLRAVVGLRRRHKKERFAVEDHLSPSLRAEETSAITGDSCSDAEGSTTPPQGETFLTEAQAIFGNVLEAERLLLAARKSGANAASVEFQQVVDLCMMKVAALQTLSERLAAERQSESRGWLSGLLGREAVSQLDQHEAAIVWFLSHRLSLLVKQIEARRDEMERREREAARLRLVKKHALASTGTQPAEGLGVCSMEQFAEKYGMDQEQMLLLAEENESLVREYQGMREQITTTQASLNEIGRLQSTLQEQLVYQSAQIDRLFDDAVSTIDTVKRANTQLARATRGQSTSVKLFLWFIVIATLFVLTIHIVSD